MTVDIGQEAPDFELTAAQSGDKVKLSEVLAGGRAVVLVFHPFAFTSVCDDELCAIRDDHSAFTDAGAEVMTVSCDPTPAQRAWASQQGWTFPVLSDFWPHGEVARRYGVFDDDRGCARRATIVIGADGKVVDRFESPDLKTPRPQERYQEAVAKL